MDNGCAKRGQTALSTDGPFFVVGALWIGDRVVSPLLRCFFLTYASTQARFWSFPRRFSNSSIPLCAVFEGGVFDVGCAGDVGVEAAEDLFESVVVAFAVAAGEIGVSSRRRGGIARGP